jgi:iron complex outermembrane receptor protein
MQHRTRLATYTRAFTIWKTLAIMVALIAFCAEHAEAADAKSRFDIPAEALGKALRDLGIQANINISYDADAVRHFQSPSLKGEYTVADALSRILIGTHLRPVSINGTTIQIASDDTATVPVITSDAGQTPGLEEIIVTGTNISNVENKTVPLLSFDREAIARSGYASLSDFITALPQNVKSGPNSADGILTGVAGDFNNIENSTAANLRGLGASSTLTLINGHRVAAASEGTGVDLSMIPLAAVERVEVLTDGSSAVYGADAVGGVVNIILRKDFNGQETDARLDTLSRGGGELKQLGQSIGRTWSTGGVLGVFQFDDNNALRSDQRSFTGPISHSALPWKYSATRCSNIIPDNAPSLPAHQPRNKSSTMWATRARLAWAFGGNPSAIGTWKAAAYSAGQAQRSPKSSSRDFRRT